MSNSFNPRWQVRVDKDLIIAQTEDRFEAVEFLKAMRKFYSRKITLTAEYIGPADNGFGNGCDIILERGTRRSL